MSELCAYPTLDDPDEKKREYIKKLVNHNNRFRMWHMYRMAINTHFYRGAQWLMAPRQLRGDSTGGFRFETDSGFNGRTPVDNYIATNVDNEVARLLGKKYQPDSRAEHNEPELIAAAKLGRSIVEHDAKKKLWNAVQYELAFDLATVGTAIAKTYLDENHYELSPLAGEEAMECPGCKAKFSSAKIGYEDRESIPNQNVVQESEEGLSLSNCPMCEGAQELRPYQMSVEEVGTPDAIGRQMGEFAPSLDVCWEAVNWSQFFPENSGFGVEPHNMCAWAQKTPRALDYIAARCPEFKDLKAEDPNMLMRNDPILGYNLVPQGGAGTLFNEGIYDNHAALIECHIDPYPYPGLEMGHSIYMCGDEIYSKPLCVEVEVPKSVSGEPQEPRKVKRVTYAAARRSREPKRFWGRTPVDNQVPLQRRLNRLDAQVEDLRERGGPMVCIPPDVEIHDRSFEGALRVMEIESENPGWSIKESIVNADPITGNAYMQEREKIVLSLQRLGAPDVELGKNPTGVNTIGQLQILAEQAEQVRGPSEDELKALLDKTWSAYLELKWAFQREDTKLEVEGAPNSYEQKSYVGTDLLGQTRVTVTAKGGVDKQVLRMETAERAFQMGLYGDALNNQTAREEMLEMLNAPRIDAAKSLQLERANQAWTEFKADGTIPVFDDSNHDPGVWYQSLLRSWLSDDGLSQQREADWNNVLRGIAGWRPKYDQAAMLDQAQRAEYEGFPPEQWQSIYDQKTAAINKVNQTGATQAQSMGPGATPPMAMPPPTAPPQNGQFLPASIDQQLLMLWRGMLGTAFPAPEVIGAMTDEKQQRGAIVRERLLRMFAVLMQCKILFEAMAQMAMPAPGAPGMPEQMAKGAA